MDGFGLISDWKYAVAGGALLFLLSFFRRWKIVRVVEIPVHIALICFLLFRGLPLGGTPMAWMIGWTAVAAVLFLWRPRLAGVLSAASLAILFLSRLLPRFEMADIAVALGSGAVPVVASTGLLSAVALPGLSYLVFRWIRLWMDARRLPSPPSFCSMIQYAFFAPWFLSGPISSFTEFERAYRESPVRDRTLIMIAVARFIWGATKFFALSSLFYQMTFTRLLADPAPIGVVTFVVALFVYPAYLFLNFSGFIDMMIALTALLGFPSTENFDRPYLATTVGDFWRSWHISLTELLKDFVYIPVVRACENRGLHSPIARYAIGTVAVFLLMAVWHGSTWNYLVFSGLQVVGLVAERAAGRRREGISDRTGAGVWLRRAAIWCFLAVSFFFFENSPAALAEILRRSFFGS